MKKVLIAILAVATMAFVIGCGSGDTSGTDNATPPAAKDKGAAPAGGATAGTTAPAATAGGTTG
jgi:hypothetical protein